MRQLQKLMTDVHNWANDTFGNQPPLAVLHHLHKETKELIDAIEQKKNDHEILFEFADCFILLVQAASKYGLTAEHLLTVSETKFEICKKRQWGKPDANGVVEHVRIAPEQVQADDKMKNAIESSLNEWQTELTALQNKMFEVSERDVKAGAPSEEYAKLCQREIELERNIKIAEHKLGKFNERIESPSFNDIVTKIRNSCQTKEK